MSARARGERLESPEAPCAEGETERYQEPREAPLRPVRHRGEAGAGRHGQPLGCALRERAGAERLDLPLVVARRDRRAPRDEKERRGQDETRGGEEPRAARAEPPLRERPEGRGPERDGRERQALVLRQDRRAEEEPRGESLRETRAFRRSGGEDPLPRSTRGESRCTSRRRPRATRTRGTARTPPRATATEAAARPALDAAASQRTRRKAGQKSA